MSEVTTFWRVWHVRRQNHVLLSLSEQSQPCDVWHNHFEVPEQVISCSFFRAATLENSENEHENQKQDYSTPNRKFGNPILIPVSSFVSLGLYGFWEFCGQPLLSINCLHLLWSFEAILANLAAMILAECFWTGAAILGVSPDAEVAFDAFLVDWNVF